METLGQRIKYARSQAKLKQHQVAAHFGIDRVNVSQWESDTTKPDIEKLPKLAGLLKANLGWLIDGLGLPPTASDDLLGKPTLVSSFDPDDDGNGYNRENWRPSMPGAIPEIDAKLGAGEGAVGELVNLHVGNDNYSGHRVVAEWILSETFLRHEAKASRQDTVIMEIIGDSMSPTYGPGDRVLVDQAQTRLVADTVYAISDGYGEPQIKRLQRIPFSDPVMVKIISDNPSLSSFDVELERLTIIGRVCGHIARK